MMILLAVWQFGATMVIFLAGLKQIPKELYEAAEVDGAGPWHRFRSVTIPMLSPVIFFNLLLETDQRVPGVRVGVHHLQRLGRPGRHDELLTLYLYKRGFADLQMGYASAIAWVLRDRRRDHRLHPVPTQKSWVHYSGDNR